jgi:ABC-type transport system involved in multi-copper enzyme maturation permease subunit
VTLARDMIAAELLKLRKRRGLFWWALVLNVVSAIVILAIVQIVHLADRAEHGPAGGTDNFNGVVQALAAFGALTAILIGTTAGAGDVGAGVFRDLVTTGRSRVALFAVRLPGAALMLVPFIATGFAIALAGCYGLAGDGPTPSASVAAQFGAWLLVGRLFDLCLAVGFASLLGSRGIAIGVVLAWDFAIAPILASIRPLGALRELISAAASDRLRPLLAGDQHLAPMSLGAAIAVLLAWAAAFLAAGAWRTATRDA